MATRTDSGVYRFGPCRRRPIGLAALWKAASSPVRAHQRDRAARLRSGVYDEPQARREEVRHRERARFACVAADVQDYRANGDRAVYPTSDRRAAQWAWNPLLVQRERKSAEDRSVVRARR